MPGFLSLEPSARKNLSCDDSRGGAVSVRLVLSTDEICAACPLNINGVCENSERVIRFDEDVLKACNLSEGTVMRFSDLAELVVSRIFVPGLRGTICGDCQWSCICGSEDDMAICQTEQSSKGG